MIERRRGKEQSVQRVKIFDEQTRGPLTNEGYSIVRLSDDSLRKLVSEAYESKPLETVVKEAFSTFTPSFLLSDAMLGRSPLRNTEIAFLAHQIYIPESNLKDYWQQLDLVKKEREKITRNLGVKVSMVIPDASTIGFLELSWKISTGEDLMPDIFVRTNTRRDMILPGLRYSVGRHHVGEGLQFFEYPDDRGHPNIYAPAILIPRKRFGFTG